MLAEFRIAEKVIHERIGLDQDRVTEDVREVLEVIDANLFRPDFKVGALELGKVTRANFQEQLNATPHLYVRVRRIEGALYLLDYTEAPVPPIAATVGYPKVFSFNYTFKKLMGTSPIEERRQWRRRQADQGGPLPAGTLLVTGFGGHRIYKASIDRLCLVGALTPKRAAFHVATLWFVASKAKPLERLPQVWDEYLASSDADPDVRPPVPEIDLAPAAFDPAEEQALAERAAGPTRGSLGRFESEAPEELRTMIARLREDFLVPGFSVEEMKRELLAAGVDVRSFTRAMGVPPWQYALEAKMETASRLLRDTSLSVQAIAFAVGYSDPPQFRRIFAKWSGQLTPSEYRARIREVVSRVGPPPEEFVNWRFLERIWNGTAEAAEKEELLRYLERVYAFEPCELAVPEELEAAG